MCVCVGAGLLKMKSERGWGGRGLFSYLILFQGLSFLQKLLYSLPNFVMHLKKKHSFMKKSYSKLSKNEPENIP